MLGGHFDVRVPEELRGGKDAVLRGDHAARLLTERVQGLVALDAIGAEPRIDLLKYRGAAITLAPRAGELRLLGLRCVDHKLGVRFRPKPAQQFDGLLIDVHRATGVRGLDRASLGILHEDLTLAEINMIPTQAVDLPAPQASGNSEQDDEKLRRSLCGKLAPRLTQDLPRIDLGDVAHRFTREHFHSGERKRIGQAQGFEEFHNPRREQAASLPDNQIGRDASGPPLTGVTISPRQEGQTPLLHRFRREDRKRCLFDFFAGKTLGLDLGLALRPTAKNVPRHPPEGDAVDGERGPSHIHDGLRGLEILSNSSDPFTLDLRTMFRQRTLDAERQKVVVDRCGLCGGGGLVARAEAEGQSLVLEPHPHHVVRRLHAKAVDGLVDASEPVVGRVLADTPRTFEWPLSGHYAAPSRSGLCGNVGVVGRLRTLYLCGLTGV